MWHPNRQKAITQIGHLQTYTYHFVQRLRKSVQRILRYFFSERSLKQEKKKEINASKKYSPVGNLTERAKTKY